MRTYSKQKKARHVKWHKQYNQEHNYATKETKGKKFTWAEMYLIWNKQMQNGKILTDVQIAKLLKRSLQSIQLKRHKMRMEYKDDIL